MTDSLAGKPLHYLIGADADSVGVRAGAADVVTEVPYDATMPARAGISIAYCNLFDERESYVSGSNTGAYGPYLLRTDTAGKYDEGVIDPCGRGWAGNLNEQFTRRKDQGFEYIELDNPDAYAIADVIGAIELAAKYSLKVIAKNPGLMERGGLQYVAHPSVYGIIVEKDAGGPAAMNAVRVQAGKPDLPIWFVAFGSGRQWAMGIAQHATGMRNIGVTFSRHGEYGSSEDILKPHI